MLDKIKIKIDKKNIDKEKLRIGYVKQHPNKRILGLKFHLGVYNLSNKNNQNKFNNWIRKVGESPVIYDNYMTKKTKDQLSLYFSNQGYRNVEVEGKESFNRKKAQVLYNIVLNEPYLIDSLSYSILDENIKPLIFSDTTNSLLKRGVYFDVSILEKERLRIERLMRSNGYYTFSKDNIYFKADTTVVPKRVNLTIEVREYKKKIKDISTILPYKQYKINDVYFYINCNTKLIVSDSTQYLKNLDTTVYKNIHFIYENKLIVKPQSLVDILYIEPDSIYDIRNYDQTYKHLTSLRLFKSISINYNEIDNFSNSDSINNLDCAIFLNTFVLQSYSPEIEGTSSSGNLGIAGNLNYQHKNLFKGAEILDFNVRGATEAIKNRNTKVITNTLELGTEAKISFPKFLLPLRSENFIKRYNPKTTITISYNYQQRPDYTRTLANSVFGYNWKASQQITHLVNPIDVNFVRLPPSNRLTQFREKIKDSYLENSFKDHLIAVSGYSFIFNNQSIEKNTSFHFFRFNIESGGNLISVINKQVNSPVQEDGSYHLLGNRYSQFTRSDIDFRYFKPLNKTDKIAYRFFAGVGIPYGNSEVIPFEKKYYSGGSNSIRAWQVRTLGPGSYKEVYFTYPNSLGDIKLETNIEYRFDLFWIIKAALFVDAGNVWSINNVEKQTGALFQVNQFYKDVAIGSGIGMRWDFSFFIFRFDAAVKTRDPAAIPGQKWILGYRKLYWDDFNFVVGIGYPF